MEASAKKLRQKEAFSRFFIRVSFRVATHSVPAVNNSEKVIRRRKMPKT